MNWFRRLVGIFKSTPQENTTQLSVPTPATPLHIPAESEQISNHFTWKDALFLPQWNRCANEADGVTKEILDNLKQTFSLMDLIRDALNKPIVVHVALRPTKYNDLVGGASKSCHLVGKAVDFHVSGITCDGVRQFILDKNILISLSLRMEDKPGSSWVHLDCGDVPPGGHRFFKP